MTQLFRRMSNLSVRLKLIIACGSLALLTVLVGVLGLGVFTMVQNAFQVVVTHSLPAVDAVVEADRDMQQALVAERTLLFMKMDTPDAKIQREEHTENLRQVLQRWQQYTAIPASEDEQQLWPVFDTAWRAWEQISQEVLALAAEDTPSARRDAVDLSLSEGKSKFEAARQVLNKLAEMRLAQVNVQAQAKERRVEQLRRWMVGGVLGACVLALVLSLILAGAIARPLRHVANVLQRVAEGDLRVTVEVASKDEVGQVATATRQMVENLRALLTQVNTSAAHTATVSQQLSGAATQLSTGAQQQAASLEETVASLEQITGTVKQNASNAQQASQLAIGACATAEKGGQVVTAAVAAMDEMSQSSKRIVDIIATIDSIAFQTNLLALNAAVEAARAGEQGRGFAVVAAEVRNLAQRSAAAAKEIKGLIEDSVHKMQNGSQLVHRSGQTLQEIVIAVKQVTDMIAEITVASQEQSAEIDQVHRSVSHMDLVTQNNTGQTEALTSTAHTLAVQAEQLQRLVGHFKLDPSATEQPLAQSTTPVRRHVLTSQLPSVEDSNDFAPGYAAAAAGGRH